MIRYRTLLPVFSRSALALQISDPAHVDKLSKEIQPRSNTSLMFLFCYFLMLEN